MDNIYITEIMRLLNEGEECMKNKKIMLKQD